MALAAVITSQEDLRNLVPSIGQAEKILRELESEGSMRLDRDHGIV